jgi:1-acyl-sn-glycerol-3-phosphate acyltransferase
MKGIWKRLVVLLAKAIAWGILGLRVQHRTRLPIAGPAILVANHNSHLDALVLMALYPMSMAHHLRPVANEQYFLRQNRYLAWFARQVLDIIPVTCSGASPDTNNGNYRTFLHQCDVALARRQILILFPEGSRGEPEHLSPFHSGIAHLAKRHPEVPVVPIFLQGLGKALPKGDLLLVPFVCSAAIGLPLFWQGNKPAFLRDLLAAIQGLSGELGATTGAIAPPHATTQ